MHNIARSGLDEGLRRHMHVNGANFPFTYQTHDFEVNVSFYSAAEDTTLKNSQARIVSVASGWDREVHVHAITENPSVFPEIKGTLGFYSPESELSITGNTKVYGQDTNPDGTPGVLPTVPAISSIISEDELMAQQGNAQFSGDPDFVKQDMDHDELMRYTNLYMQNGTVFTGSNYGTPESPSIMIINGEQKITDNTNMAGILIVPAGAMLELRGNFNFQGLIVVLGELDIRGNVSIYGSMKFGSQAKIEIDETDSSEGTFSGNTHIYYSSAALDHINNNLGWWPDDRPPRVIALHE